MIVHGTTVAIGGRAVLIVGPSGVGKSALALSLMGMGAGLVADDRTVLTREGDRVMADVPPALRGRIEARHVGILAADAVGPAPLAVVIDLSGPGEARLPEPRSSDYLGVTVPLLMARPAPELAAALRQYLIGGRLA